MKPSFLIGRARAITCLLILGLPIIAQAKSSASTYVRSYEPKTPLMLESITLEDAIKRTLADNPNLHEFEFRQQVLVGETKTAGLKPGLTAGIELENLLGTGEVSALKELEMTLTLSSVIELDDKPAARLGVLSARREQQDVEKKISTLDLLGELNRRYINVLSLQALLAVTNEAEALARYTLEAVSKRVEAGASPLLEQKRALSALAQSQLDVDVTNQNLRFAIRSLAIMWGEQNPSFKRVDGKLFVFQETVSFNALSMAIQNSPHIDLFAQQSRIQSAQLRLVQAGNSPDIEWSAGIRRIQGIDETAFVAGVSVPLFQKQRNLGAYEAQKARLDLIEQQKQSDVRNLLHSVNQALGEQQRALLEVEAIQQSVIPPLKDALNLVENAYLDGRFSYLEWVSTRQQFLNTRLALINAATQVHLSSAEIEALTGISLITERTANPSGNGTAGNAHFDKK